MIPHQFHRIWLGGEEPAELAGFAESWEKMNPGWPTKTWRQPDLPPLRNQSLFDAASSYAQKADIARYELVHLHGGFYVDADMCALASLAPHVGDASFVVAEEAPGVLANEFFGAAAGDPLLERVIRELPAHVRIFSGENVSTQTGPTFFARTIRRAAAAEGRELTVLPRHLLFPYGHEQTHLREGPFPAAIAAHLFHASWTDSGPPPTPLLLARLRRQLSAGLKPRARDATTRLKRYWTRLDPRAPASHGTYMGDGTMFVLSSEGLRLVMPAGDLAVTVPFLAEGTGDAAGVALIRSLARRGSACLYLGRDPGHQAIVMAHRVNVFGRVYCHLADPGLVPWARKNAALNPPADHITFIELDPDQSPSNPDTSPVTPALSDVFRQEPELAYARAADARLAAELVDRLRRQSVTTRIVWLDLCVDDRALGNRWDPFCENLRDLGARHSAEVFESTGGGQLGPSTLDRALAAGHSDHLLLKLSRS